MPEPKMTPAQIYEMATTRLRLNDQFDGEVYVHSDNGYETIRVHNAIAQASDVSDDDYRPSAMAVDAAQRAVDEFYNEAF
jgi:hypothetical protein